MTQQNSELYKPCNKITRTHPDHTADAELMDKIRSDFRVLPSFEKTLMEHKYIAHYSLNTNELLKCRWDQCRKNPEKRVVEPYQFPSARDLHFYNGMIRYLPALTPSRHPDMRIKTKAGPLIDKYGEVPIPNDLLMKRGTAWKGNKSIKVQKENSSANIEKNMGQVEKKEVKEKKKVGIK